MKIRLPATLPVFDDFGRIPESRFRSITKYPVGMEPDADAKRDITPVRVPNESQSGKLCFHTFVKLRNLLREPRNQICRSDVPIVRGFPRTNRRKAVSQVRNPGFCLCDNRPAMIETMLPQLGIITTAQVLGIDAPSMTNVECRKSNVEGISEFLMTKPPI